MVRRESLGRLDPPRARVEATSTEPRRRRAQADGRRPSGLTVEEIVAVESPREVRLAPSGRLVCYTADAAGARQLFVLPLRGGPARQLTASEKDVSEPAWSPDGRRLAFVRDRTIWIIGVDGSRPTEVSPHPAGSSMPRWSPDGRRLAFVSRRRGWSQIWVVEAPIPRRGRPPRRPSLPQPRPVTPAGIDVEDYAWSPDGRRIAYVAGRSTDLSTCQVTVVDLEAGSEAVVGGEGSWDTAPRWAPDGSLLWLTDADGWFQVVRLTPDGNRVAVTTEPREHGEPSGGDASAPLVSPDGALVAHVTIHDGLVDLVVRAIDTGAPVRRRGRPPKRPRPGPSEGPGTVVNPWPGVWRPVGWLPDGTALVAVGESERRPPDVWLLPVPGRAAANVRPRALTDSLPVALAPAFSDPAFVPGERVVLTARDGLRLEGTLWRPREATGRRGGRRVPAVVFPHGGPTWQAYRSWQPFKQLLVREGFAILDIDFRGSTGYGRDFRLANRGEWGHADAHDVIDAARWLLDQPWCDGRLAAWGGSYGGYLVLCVLTEEPSLWRAGVDLYGDSEIAESYRHGDRVGRLDLERQMGRPDDPEAAERYRRGSPVYRAERIEAPILLLHGRKDKRVVPLMTEKMVEALEIEGKHYEVHWYDEEGHGWEKRETRRDAFGRILAFLRRHVLDEPSPAA
ncbi:MAG TPA: S9 family peptidase [Candidatus Binatia bacterium]|nr:S9 family peptidase [Candidatus Binatia bacterium]